MVASAEVLSHPLRVRGLKPERVKLCQRVSFVASFTGAWVETTEGDRTGVAGTSHPLRVRGLKLSYSRGGSGSFAVASFTGAWVETPFHAWGKDAYDSRILYGCVG